jgi:glucose-1-phosphate cytidylyltransferase
MKAVILCGGQGTRIRDISEVLPKPMLMIGDRPILWHIMKIYAHYGIKDFVLCLGYKGWVVKEYFINYAAKTSDISLKLGTSNITVHHKKFDEADWNITLVETGEAAQTGARLWNARHYLEDCGSFCMTYGDGVADVDIHALLETHKKLGVKATVTGVHPSGRFGEMEVKGDLVTEFNEKPNVGSGMINGGFMVMESSALAKYFRSGEDLILEIEVMNLMVRDRQLGLYQHKGFWQCVDTPREYNNLCDAWKADKAPWKVWDAKTR